ncbi:hypothetical protein HWV62_14006 [Athelia sp. TMB]|nr:hypothetical protein HWV62_14006 [Athelia sp. TMB]
MTISVKRHKPDSSRTATTSTSSPTARPNQLPASDPQLHPQQKSTSSPSRVPLHLSGDSPSQDRDRRVQSSSRRQKEYDHFDFAPHRSPEQHRPDSVIESQKYTDPSRSFSGTRDNKPPSSSNREKIELPGAAQLLNYAQGPPGSMPHRIEPPQTMSPPSSASSASYPAGISGPGAPAGKPHPNESDHRHRDYGSSSGSRYSGQQYPHIDHGPGAPGTHSPFPYLHSPALSHSSLDQHPHPPPHSQSNSPYQSRRQLPPASRTSMDSQTSYSNPYYPPDPVPQPPRYAPQPTGYHAPPPEYAHSVGPHRTLSPRTAHAYPYPPRPSSGYERQEPMPHHSPHVPHQAPYPPPHSYPSYSVPSMGSGSAPPGGPGYGGGGGGMPTQNYPPIVHTTDATTKLNDRVRRRCFNCCTTDTSTWRRSNLSPGKVLCNKCGLFERTHSRPRPDQFPHRRGSMASNGPPPSGQSSRSPPQQYSHQQPGAGMPPLPQHLQQPQQQQQNHYQHPTIAPLAHIPDRNEGAGPGAGGGLPEIQSWLHEDPGQSRQEGTGSGTSSRSRSPAR